MRLTDNHVANNAELCVNVAFGYCMIVLYWITWLGFDEEAFYHWLLIASWKGFGYSTRKNSNFGTAGISQVVSVVFYAPHRCPNPTISAQFHVFVDFAAVIITVQLVPTRNKHVQIFALFFISLPLTNQNNRNISAGSSYATYLYNEVKEPYIL